MKNETENIIVETYAEVLSSGRIPFEVSYVSEKVDFGNGQENRKFTSTFRKLLNGNEREEKEGRGENLWE